MARASKSSPEVVRGDTPSLGESLRALRSRHGWSLSEVASRTKIAASTLSRIENNQLSLTYQKLLQLCRGLNIDLSELLSSGGAPSSGPALGRRAYTAPGGGRPMQVDHYSYRYLCTDLARKKMTPILGVVTARTLEEAGGFLRHEGEEFVYVVRGELEFHSEYYEPLRVKEGGSFYFDSQMGHAFVSVSDEPAEMLSVCTIPEAELVSVTKDHRGLNPSERAGNYETA